jgi:tRNA modification GTPase
MLDSSALLLYFPGPSSATGEDILELHVHGGPAVVKAVLAAIPLCASSSAHHIRYAEPGEFTHRAFLNGRLDLTQVEALGDALSAETEQQRRMSMRATSGSLAIQYEGWRQQLLYARGEMEALIDFSEDQHFDESPAELCASIARQIEVLKRQLNVHSQNAMRGEMLRKGISISLLGAPNAGKSSLLNRIIGREAAIVSSEAGTTRDVVEVGLDLGGYFCRLGDTAGLRQSQLHATKPDAEGGVSRIDTRISDIEKEGMRRAKERAEQSDVVIVVLSCEPGDNDSRIALRLDPEVCSTAARLIQEKNNVIVVINKADLLPHDTRNESHRDAVSAALRALPGLREDAVHLVSCKTMEGRKLPSLKEQSDAASPTDPSNVQQFLQGLTLQFAQLTAALELSDGQNQAGNPNPSVWQESLSATERHRVLLAACIDHLEAFLSRVSDASVANSDIADDIGGEVDMVAAAEDLRSAGECLARITGRGVSGDVEEVLGVVFEKFCVGK